MFHFNPKISIEVCPHHSQVTPLYGAGFTVSRSGGSRVRHDIDLQLDAFLSNIAHASFPSGARKRSLEFWNLVTFLAKDVSTGIRYGSQLLRRSSNPSLRASPKQE